MQALSIWPSKNDFWVTPKLEVEDTQLGSSCAAITKRRRKKRWGLGLGGLSGRSGLVLGPTCLRGIKSWACSGSAQFDFDYRVLSGHSKFKLCIFGERMQVRFRASVALAWTLEGQAIAHEFVKQDSGSGPLDGISRKSDNFDKDQDNEFDVVENEDEDLVESKEEKGVGDEVRKERNLRIGGMSRKNVNVHNVDEDKENKLVHCENGNEDPEGSEKDSEELRKKRSPRIDVRLLASHLASARTVEDIDEVLKDKGELPLQVYSSMIRGFGKDKRLHSAMALVQWLKEKKQDTGGSVGPNLFIYNSLLGAVKQSEEFEEVEKIINDMAAGGVVPNVVTYNTLMGIYIQQGREIEALDLFEEIRTKGLSPSPASYSTALLAYRRLEDGFGALKFYVQLKDWYHKGEIGKNESGDWENEFAKLENFTVRICYQVMRRWLVKSENLSTNVLKLLTEMDRVGLQTGREDYERLVWACTREEHYIVARELYNRIRERHSEISLSVCNHVIWLMGKARKWWSALEIYEDLLDKGPKPNNMSYELIVAHFNILLSAARKRGIWKWGVRLLNKMEDKGLKPGSREWNAVIVACSKASETSAAVQMFKRMVEQGETPTIISYGALLSALEKGKLYDEALRVWQHMLKVGVEPNLYAYTIMASIYTAQGKFNIVDSIIRDMVSSGINPTVVTYNAIISGCAHNSMGSAAYEWFHKMKAENIPANEVTFEMLIEALGKDGKPKLAYDLYVRAHNEGLNLSSKAYDAVIQSSQTYGASVDASVLGPRPPDRKTKVQTRKNLSQFCNLADVPRRSKPFDRNEIYTPQTEGNLAPI
ncbi:protein LOW PHOTOSYNTHETIC EFFICIENCY 1, chloroplastic-like isoform X2 [Diospyros lotus]|uniref:protein LOW PHOTOSYNTHETIC EFFICIENCY 1, chloroplastic-like isoform X2 n=1 Tax=Diospyros lotus TaxID=55363 RepID=UPI0022541522|nr:protein LOW PHOTOSYNTHETIC EFFICIENCY 1, chloroplastic-like isoform X2 [Diospyros lotus]